MPCLETVVFLRATSVQPSSVLFVCLGNICRSPLAEGIFREVATLRGLSGLTIDSAGTGGWHAGSVPDPRSIAVAQRYGIDIAGQKARKVRLEDFEAFDLILGMDRSNVDDLRRFTGDVPATNVHLFMDYALGSRRDVPDPYYSGADGFENVYRMIREASEALAEKLGTRLSAPSVQASSTM